MQSFDPFEQFVQSYETEIVKREACLEIQQKLEHFCIKLENLQRELQRVNTPIDDDRYQQLEVRIRHYRYQLKYELLKLAEKLLEIRQSQPQEPIDWVGQLIEERRQRQEREESDTQLRRREREELQRRRHEKKRQLLDTIAAQENYYEAADLAIEVHYAKEDLKSLEALEEVVNALLDKINDCNRDGKAIVIAGTPEWKLSRMYEKATKLRQQKYPSHLTLVPPSGNPSSRSRAAADDCGQSDEKPDPYAELAGKVVIFGGQNNVKVQVEECLRQSKVHLVWCTAEDGDQWAKQTESHIAQADLVVIITGRGTPHKQTISAKRVAKNCRKPLTQCDRASGKDSLLEHIKIGLLGLQLQRNLG
ncbi:DUF2325 domain-containing protein [Phormidesmis priestleyi ULC007]|uniref:DUF2325 domain-containing protein n=1 Tax=Phormidesmis priestleyi ULC007 TaxID=1920490 RepID=A0A2T1DMD5_9CYAN|nr:DUF2325 domain-containing protein [Phormidesmis priestleyi]PSB21667.1 DUF2325 domain-containing protein [Phormidesmis priestleyi ULC007]PZO50790.1 MAG: DUF2325 domain-containing protein [Phormidesmis priestleyi]